MNKLCPKCGVVNVPTATRCECGFNLEMYYRQPSRLARIFQVAGIGSVIGALVACAAYVLLAYLVHLGQQQPMHGPWIAVEGVIIPLAAGSLMGAAAGIFLYLAAGQ